MGTMTAGVGLLNDNHSLQLDIFEDGKRKAYLLMTAVEVDNLTHALSKLRRNMKPEVVRTLPEGAKIEGEMDPIWAVPSDKKAPDKVLMLRHFGFGWLSFFLPGESAQKLGEALLSGQSQTGVQSQSRH